MHCRCHGRTVQLMADAKGPDRTTLPRISLGENAQMLTVKGNGILVNVHLMPHLVVLLPCRIKHLFVDCEFSDEVSL